MPKSHELAQITSVLLFDANKLFLYKKVKKKLFQQSLVEMPCEILVFKR